MNDLEVPINVAPSIGHQGTLTNDFTLGPLSIGVLVFPPVFSPPAAEKRRG